MFSGESVPESVRVEKKPTTFVDSETLPLDPDNLTGDPESLAEAEAFLASLQYEGNETTPLVRAEIDDAESLIIELQAKNLTGERIDATDIQNIGLAIIALNKLKTEKASELSDEESQLIKNVEVLLMNIRQAATV